MPASPTNLLNRQPNRSSDMRREDGGGREGVCLASKGRFPVRHRRQVQRDSGPVGDRVKHRRAFPARAAAVAVAVAADAAFGPTD